MRKKLRKKLSRIYWKYIEPLEWSEPDNAPTFISFIPYALGVMAVIGGLVFCAGKADAYMPSLPDRTEVRVIATSQKGFDSLEPKNWVAEGILLGNHVLHEDFYLSGIFKLSASENENSELGALATYHINKFVSIGVAGNLNDKRDLGAIFVVNGKFRVGSMIFMPFVLVDHKAVGEIGIAQSFEIEKVLFSVGISYLPPLGEKNKYHNIRIMIGSGLMTSKGEENEKLGKRNLE